MKKLISSLLVGILTISLSFTSVSAANENKLSKELDQETIALTDTLLTSGLTFTLDNSVDFLTFLNSGKDMSMYKEGYLQSLNTCLQNNDGKIIIYGSENIGGYGAVISILQFYGIDPSQYCVGENTYNLVEKFENLDLSYDSTNPYYYRYAINVASEKFAKKIIDNLVLSKYTLGSGFDYWGYSCDNTAEFLVAIHKYESSYSQYVEDAKKLMKTYETDKGSFYNPAYGTEPNGNSTAKTLMAYAIEGDVDNAYDTYKKLIDNFKISSGQYKYQIEDTEGNSYANKDVLQAIIVYNEVLDSQNYNHKTHKEIQEENKYICLICGHERIENNQQTSSIQNTIPTTNQPVKSVETGDQSQAEIFISLSFVSGALYLILRKKYERTHI
ncbi:MAG: hypothetical protein ACI4SR_07620 [Faecalibacillus sp.]